MQGANPVVVAPVKVVVIVVRILLITLLVAVAVVRVCQSFQIKLTPLKTKNTTF